MSEPNNPKKKETILVKKDKEDPEYYAELLRNHHGLPSDERRILPRAGIQDVDQHVQTLLDAVAHISLCQRGNVSATMASLNVNEVDKGTLETRLYIVSLSDHKKNDEAATGTSCAQHLQSVFDMLCKVPYKPTLIVEGSSSRKVISNDLENDFIEIGKVIHSYSFEIFAYRVTKREQELSDIRRYIEQDRSHFTDEQYSTLVAFLRHVERIIAILADARATKKITAAFIKALLNVYLYWTNHNILPKDELADKNVTLLDLADNWFADKHGIRFQLRSWALKIMSFLISANRLFAQTQSHRLRKLFEGKFSVKVLQSLPPTTPYCCDLSSEAVQEALETALAGSSYLSKGWDGERKSFIETIADSSMVVRENTTVHAELAMIKTMVSNGKMKDVLPYIGVSKLSCIMCSHYIRAFNEATQNSIVTKSSPGKTYQGWSWPGLPDRDEDIRVAFLRRIRRQLLEDFEKHVRTIDGSVGSAAPKWDYDATASADKINELLKKAAAGL